MKGFLVILAIVASVSGQESCPPGADSWAHAECNLFWVCDNGVPVEEVCPGSLYFNPATGNCDFPENVPECQGGTRPPVTVAPTTTTTSTTTTTGATSDSTTKLPPGQCPAEGVHQIPHEERCDAYYVCINGQRLEPYHVCPENLLFDPILEECNFASDVECTPVVTSTSLPQTSTIPPQTSTSPPQTTSSRPDLPECPATGTSTLPYPGDCTLYVMCVEEFSIVYRCPDGELFDTAELKCKLASIAVCTVRSNLINTIRYHEK